MNDTDLRLLNRAMRDLQPGTLTETLFANAHQLYQDGVLQVEENRIAGCAVVTFYVGPFHEDGYAPVLEIKAMIDAHTGRGYTPPWGTLHVYDADGNHRKAVKIPAARWKILG